MLDQQISLCSNLRQISIGAIIETVNELKEGLTKERDALKILIKSLKKMRIFKEVLIFLDLFGGTCYNICSFLFKKKNIRIIAGVNLPILIETVIYSKDYNIDQLVNNIKENIGKYLVILGGDEKSAKHTKK